MSIQSIGYNPNFAQKAVSFRATAPNVVSNPSTDKTKEGMSTGAKWGICLGLTALAAIGIYVATRGKAGNPKKIAEHIDFTPAKSLEEAKLYAKENFGTKLELDNLEVANYINEGITDVSNRMKGKSALPKQVSYSNEKRIAMMGWNQGSKTLIIYKWYIDAMLRGAEKEKMTLKEYLIHFHKNDGNALSTIYHELGHANHAKNCKDYYRMGKLHELEKAGIDDDLTQKFFTDIKDNKIIQEYFKPYKKNYGYKDSTAYAFESPCEYIAEVFRLKMEGKQIPEEVEKIYKKYGGPPI